MKKVFIRSGIRFDYVLADKDQTFLSELVKDHVSGQLRVAPEHVSNRVLPIWENRATKYIRNLSAASMRATKDGEAAVRTSVFYVVPSGV